MASDSPAPRRTEYAGWSVILTAGAITFLVVAAVGWYHSPTEPDAWAGLRLPLAAPALVLLACALSAAALLALVGLARGEGLGAAFALVVALGVLFFLLPTIREITAGLTWRAVPIYRGPPAS
jgi:hypothetical protein